METTAPGTQLFLVERYERSGVDEDPGPLPMPWGGSVRLITTIHLPSDQVVLTFVEAPDAETVAMQAEAAGWEIDRVLAAVPLQPATTDRVAHQAIVPGR